MTNRPFDPNNLWGDADIDPEHRTGVVTSDMDPVELQIHLGKHSQYVGFMDTIDKVRDHLAAMAQYATVRDNLLAEYGVTPVEVPQPSLFAQPLITVQQVAEPELSDAERAAISREAEALVKEQQAQRPQGGSGEFNPALLEAMRHRTPEPPEDDLGFLKYVWLEDVARREQAEEDLREARKWRDKVVEQTQESYRAYMYAKAKAKGSA